MFKSFRRIWTNNRSLRPSAVLKRVGDVDTEGVDNLPWLGANEVLDINWEAYFIV